MCDALAGHRVSALLLLTGFPEPAVPIVGAVRADRRSEQFETSGGGPQLRRAILDRSASAQYTLASFLDDRIGGNGSKKAVNALRVDGGQLVEYHELLYLYRATTL